jgi:Protein of unknown function (DUF2934)
MAKNEVVATLEHERNTTQDRPPQDDIAVRAHEIFVERGAASGHDLDDWLQAEEELIKKRGNVLSRPRTSLRQ